MPTLQTKKDCTTKTIGSLYPVSEDHILIQALKEFINIEYHELYMQMKKDGISVFDLKFCPCCETLILPNEKRVHFPLEF